MNVVHQIAFHFWKSNNEFGGPVIYLDRIKAASPLDGLSSAALGQVFFITAAGTAKTVISRVVLDFLIERILLLSFFVSLRSHWQDHQAPLFTILDDSVGGYYFEGVFLGISFSLLKFFHVVYK
jgi:hypothetical protein